MARVTLWTRLSLMASRSSAPQVSRVPAPSAFGRLSTPASTSSVWIPRVCWASLHTRTPGLVFYSKFLRSPISWCTERDPSDCTGTCLRFLAPRPGPTVTTFRQPYKPLARGRESSVQSMLLGRVLLFFMRQDTRDHWPVVSRTFQ